MNRYLKAFCTGVQDYGLLYPKQYTSFKEYRYYMKGRRFVRFIANLFPIKGKRYD